MDARSHRKLTPRQSVEAECARRGTVAVVEGCLALLDGGQLDGELVFALGGPPASWAVDDTLAPGPEYWLRVWALRGLYWAWDERAAPAVVGALQDDAWRVREMALRVVRKRGLGDAVPTVAALRTDPSHRVRATAVTVLRALTEQAS